MTAGKCAGDVFPVRSVFNSVCPSVQQCRPGARLY